MYSCPEPWNTQTTVSAGSWVQQKKDLGGILIKTASIRNTYAFRYFLYNWRTRSIRLSGTSASWEVWADWSLDTFVSAKFHKLFFPWLYPQILAVWEHRPVTVLEVVTGLSHLSSIHGNCIFDLAFVPGSSSNVVMCPYVRDATGRGRKRRMFVRYACRC